MTIKPIQVAALAYLTPRNVFDKQRLICYHVSMKHKANTIQLRKPIHVKIYHKRRLGIYYRYMLVSYLKFMFDVLDYWCVNNKLPSVK